MDNKYISDEHLSSLVDLCTAAGERIGEALSNLIDKVIPPNAGA